MLGKNSNYQPNKMGFYQYYQKGWQLCQNQDLQQALEYFNKAKKCYKPGQDDIQNLVDLMIEKSRIYKKKRKIQLAKQTLNECIQLIRQQFKNQRDKNKNISIQQSKFEIKVKCQFAQNYMAEAQKMQVIETDPKSRKQFISIINKCIDNYKFAVNSAAQVLKNYQHMLDERSLRQWQQRMLQSYINIICAMMIQLEKIQGNQQTLCPIIYKITERIEKFCEIFQKTKENLKMKSKCYYYKGYSLKRISRKFKQIQKYFKCDYNFCLQKNYYSDYEITRGQLMDLYIKNQKLKEAQPLLRGQTQKKQFAQHIISRQEKIKQLQITIKQKSFLNLKQDKQINIIKQLISLLQCPLLQWWQRFPRLIINVLPLIKSKKVSAFIHYQLGRSYHQLYDQLNAQYQCRKCIQLSQDEAQIQYECMFLLLQILINSDKISSFNEIQKQMKILAQNSQNKQFIYEISKLKQQKRQHQIRKKQIQQKTLQTEQQINLYNEMKNKKIVEQEDKREIINQQMRDEKLGHQNGPKMSFIKKPKNKEILEQKYLQFCSKNQIIIRKYIQNLMKQLKDQQEGINIDISKLFDISQKQLQIYIQISKSQKWDFRNHRITNKIIQKLTQSNFVNSIKTIKFGQLHKMISKQSFALLLSNMYDVQQIHLQRLAQKFIQTQLISNQRFVNLQVSCPYNLKILKIKSSNLTDYCLSLICGNFVQLMQLDLAANQITGRDLRPINSLAKLQKLNLSYNPIIQLSSLSNSSIKKFKLKCLKNENLQENKFNSQQLLYCQILDLSQNKQKMILYMLSTVTQVMITQQLTQLPNMRQLRVKKTNITPQIFEKLNQLLAFASNLQLLDIRFCNYKMQKCEKFSRYQKSVGKNVMIDTRALIDQPYI